VTPSSHAFGADFETFQRSLQQIAAVAGQPNPDPRTLQAVFLEAQQFYQQRLATLDVEKFDGAIASKVQSIQTEINKELRLLGMDVTFMQSARQPATIQQRQRQLGDRVLRLMQYCDVLLGRGGAGAEVEQGQRVDPAHQWFNGKS
jgi:hypothetical protein